MMVEGEAQECSEADLCKALELAHDAIRIQVKAQEELRDLAGVTSKREYSKPATDEALKEKVYSLQKGKCMKFLRVNSANMNAAINLMRLKWNWLSFLKRPESCRRRESA